MIMVSIISVICAIFGRRTIFRRARISACIGICVSACIGIGVSVSARIGISIRIYVTSFYIICYLDITTSELGTIRIGDRDGAEITHVCTRKVRSVVGSR